jgi:hypothetical protein
MGYWVNPLYRAGYCIGSVHFIRPGLHIRWSSQLNDPPPSLFFELKLGWAWFKNPTWNPNFIIRNTNPNSKTLAPLPLFTSLWTVLVCAAVLMVAQGMYTEIMYPSLNQNAKTKWVLQGSINLHKNPNMLPELKLVKLIWCQFTN